MAKRVTFKRYRQIAEVLIKYGFGQIISDLFPGFTFKRSMRKSVSNEEISSDNTYARIRMVLEELGPTFVKFGQLMSTRTEMFPPELIEELSKLQDRVGVVPFDDVIPTLDKYIPDWRDKFTSIDPKPLAAASISQVYRAVTLDGTVIALKIQRPNIWAKIEQDLVLIHNIAEMLEEKKPELRMYNPVSMVEDFAIQIRKELDFTRDGMNAERLGRNMKAAGLPRLKIPKIYWEYSGKELLAMEFVAGCRSDDLDTMHALGINPKELAIIGLKAFMIQIFQNGFYHGDPHAGNIRVSPQGELIFLDFGVCGILMKDMRNKFISLLLAILAGETDLTLKYVKNLGVKIPQAGLDELRGELYLALQDFTTQGTNANFSGLLGTIQNLFQTYNIRLPPNIMQLLKALMLVSDVAFTLDPELDFIDEVQPYLKELVAEDLRSSASLEKRAMEVKSKMEDLASLPKKLSGILEMASEGKLKVDIAAKEVATLSNTLKSATDKMVIGLIIASIVIGLSLVMMSQNNAGVLQIVAYIGAIIIIIAVAITMRRRIKREKH